MTYVPINNAEVDAESPITDLLMLRLRDNPIAIANGDAGAPRVADAALSGTATAGGSAWVLDRTALSLATVKGTEIIAWNGSATDIAINETIAGSNLYYCVNTQLTSPFDTLRQASGFPLPSGFTGQPLSGTWRARTACFGKFQDGDGFWNFCPTLWIRIS
jgi:hypothetical protein